MRHKWIHLLFSGLVLVSMVSCGPASFSSPASSVTPLPNTPAGKPKAVSPTTPEAVGPQPSAPLSTPLEPDLRQVVAQAKEDLARRVAVPIDSITVGAIIGQEFTTEAFYCRTSKDRIARDEAPQVISGYSILLSASARRYEYHASGPTVIFCRPLL